MKQSKKKRFLKDLVSDAKQYILKQSYSAVSVYHYQRIWMHLVRYAEDRQVDYFSMDFALKFLKEYEKIGDCSGLTKNDISKLRIIKVLNDLSQGNEVKRKYPCTTVEMPESFAEASEGYKKYLLRKGQKEKTVQSKLSRIRIFFMYLEEHSFSLIDIDFSVISGFYSFLSSKYATNAISNIQFTLRDFLRFSEDFRLVPKNSSRLVATIYSNKHERLPCTYSRDEINAILNAIDRSTRYGKRDYAMLLLAVQLGMRSCDICRLRTNSIHWQDRTVTFLQEKTSIHTNLPLTELLVYALADYLKNARPNSDSDLLFVHMGANPEMGYTESNLYATINKYMKKAGTNTCGKRHGMHAIRHSLSSELLKEGTPLPVISGILGHSNTEITKRYLWMDTEQLRMLALEVPYEER